MAREVAVTVRKLGKQYADGKVALRDFDLTMQAGEILALLGQNGAGKTTAIKILTTLMAPTTGAATIFGDDVVRDQAAVRRKIGVALQDTGVDPLLTGYESLRLQARLYGASAAQAHRRALELIDLFALDFADRRVATYSGGMRRRLDLALALAHQPALLVLDEPTTGLDPASRIALWDTVRHVRSTYGTTVLLTTQYLEEADALCDRVAILQDGCIIAEDAPARLKTRLHQDVVEVVLARPNDVPGLAARVRAREPEVDVIRGALRWVTPDAVDVVRAVLEATSSAGIAVATLRVTPPTLDAVFFALTAGETDPAPKRDVAKHPPIEVI